MKLKVLLILALLEFNPLFSQEKKFTAEMQSTPKDVFFLGQRGYLLFDHRYNLALIDHEANLKWNTKISVPKEYKKMSGDIIVSTSGAKLYNILHKNFFGNFLANSNHLVTQISDGGEQSSFELEYSKFLSTSLNDEINSAPQSIFCDEEFIYYLVRNSKGKKNNKDWLTLNRFEIKTNSNKVIKIETPPLLDDKNTRYWAFIGQNSREKFLCSKQFNENGKHVTMQIVAFDHEGKKLREFKLMSELNRFLRPVKVSSKSDRTFKILPGENNVLNNPFEIDFAHVYFDEFADSFYIYGLCGPKVWRGLADVYDGFHVKKFDSNGNQVFAFEGDLTSNFSSDYFRMHATPDHRSITFVPPIRGIVDINVNETHLIVSSEGRFIGELGLNKYVMTKTTVNQVSKAVGVDQICKYILEGKFKGTDSNQMMYFYNNVGEILLIWNNTKREPLKLDGYFFKRN